MKNTQQKEIATQKCSEVSARRGGHHGKIQSRENRREQNNESNIKEVQNAK
jgi:hypothetical protein